MGLILVDTSVWVDHIRRADVDLTRLVRMRQCLVHPFVLAEIALGRLSDWNKRMKGLKALPRAEPVPEDELLTTIDHLQLQGSGLGFVDAHLLASARLSGHKLWSRDKRLAARAESIGLSWSPG